MPKTVDHDERRRELAEAACAVIARDGVDGASLRAVAAESGWSVGSMRHYFATKADLLVFALEYVGDRIEQRIGERPDDGSARAGLRAAAAELLPLDAGRRQETLVWLAFTARAGVDAGLADAAQQIWRAINGPFDRRLHDAVSRGELPRDFPVERQALRLQALVDGLAVHLATTPELVRPQAALAVLDDHLASLFAGPADPDAS